MSRSSLSPLEQAHRLAQEGEDLYEEGRLSSAAQRFESAAEHYVRATLSTGDSESLQSLRLLALSHSQRAHEIVCRMRLHDAQLEDPRITPSGSRSWAKSDGSGAASGAADASSAASAALLPRLGSQLISTLEALQFGAEELLCIEMLMPTVSASSLRGSQFGGSSGAGGGGLLDSFCVVPSQAAMPTQGRGGGSGSSSIGGGSTGGGGAAAGSGAGGLVGSVGGLQACPEGGGGACGPVAHQQRTAAIAAENQRLMRENATLRQQGAEMHAALGKVQRRAAEQLRLAKKALAALHEVQAAPRPQLLPEAESKEIADLRSQLEQAHAVRRQQAEQVRKYEQRWAQLKASARRKQAQQSQQQALQHKQGGGGLGSPLAP